MYNLEDKSISQIDILRYNISTFTDITSVFFNHYIHLRRNTLKL